MAVLKIKQEDGSWALIQDPTAVKYTIEQTLSEDQKLIARANIGASKVYYGTTVPSNSLGANGDIYIMYSN